MNPTTARLTILHAELDQCRVCPKMIGPVVHGPPVASRIYLFGQAPGPREGGFGKPFAWTAGKTLFKWFEGAIGVSEETFRARVYMAAVARCFPGKASGGGDRKPDAMEVEACRTFVVRELSILEPELILPVGTLAIAETLGACPKLEAIIGTEQRTVWHGREVSVIPLPHPSGASPWPRVEPGKTLLQAALARIASHAAVRATFGLGEAAG